MLPCVVAEDLNLDVPRRADEALEEHGAVAERRARLRGCASSKLRDEVGARFDDAHAAAAAAERRLDDQREADRVGALRRRRPPPSASSSVPGTTGTPARSRKAPGGGLVAEELEQLRARSDKRDACRLARARQRRILGEESVAGMDRVDALLLGQRDDAVHVEIGLDRALALADLVGLVGLEPVQAERSSCA